MPDNHTLYWWLLLSLQVIMAISHWITVAANSEQSVGADISKLDDDIEKSEPHRALPIRIKSMYNCEEQRVVPMAPPFRGFSALVRFQCRAKLHSVERINMKELSTQMAEENGPK